MRGVVFVLVHYVGCMLDGMGRGWVDTLQVKTLSVLGVNF